MQFRPQIWTHHHTHRLYHLSLGFCFAFAALAMVGTMVTVWRGASALQGDITITATVNGVNPGPSNGTSGSYPPQPTPGPIVISIVAEPQGTIPFENNRYVFATQRPQFSGFTSVSNGLIFLTITGPKNINSTAQASEGGIWSWQSPEDLPEGIYTIRAAVFDSYDLTRSASTQVAFQVKLSAPVPGPTPGPGPSPSPAPEPIPGVPPTPEPPPSGSENLIFGVFFKVLPKYKYVTAGENVVGLITLVSNGSKEIINQEVNYRIVNSAGQEILNSDDTVSFSRQTQILKTFTTAPRTRPGDYSIIVSSTYQGVHSIAQDSFRLLAPATPATVQPTVPTNYVLWWLMILVLLLFLLLALIAFWYVRHHSRQINQHVYFAE